MFLLTAPVVENSHTYAGIYIIFLKQYPKLKKLSIPNLDINEKIRTVVLK